MSRTLLRRLVVRFSIRNRRRKAAFIVGVIRRHGVRTMILSGAGSAGAANEMIVENAIAAEADVISAFDVAARTTSRWPFVIGDGRAMPYRTQSVDLVVSNAVIEHVGGEEDQRRFLDEHRRVGRICVVTTPNRWFPVESHTSAVLTHWRRAWREGRDEFTRLLSLREFRDLLPDESIVQGRPWSATFTAVIPGDAAPSRAVG